MKTTSKDVRNSGAGYGVSKKEWASAIARVQNALNTMSSNMNTIASHEKKERDALEIIKRMHGDIPDMRGKHGQTVLMMAARRGDVRAAEMLLGRGVDIDADHGPLGRGKTALIHAIRSHAPDNDTTKMVDFLLRRKANPNATTSYLYFGVTPSSIETALQSAVSRAGSLQMVKSLLRHGARMTARRDNTNLLMLAALKRRRDIVQFFLETGFFNVNATNRWGMTALHYALQLGFPGPPAQNRLDIVRLLVLYGADPAKVNTTSDHRNSYNMIRNRYGANTVTEIRNMRNRALRQGSRVSLLAI